MEGPASEPDRGNPWRTTLKRTSIDNPPRPLIESLTANGALAVLGVSLSDSLELADLHDFVLAPVLRAGKPHGGYSNPRGHSWPVRLTNSCLPWQDEIANSKRGGTNPRLLVRACEGESWVLR